MSMNKAIHQVIMHEQIGGNKQAPSQPTKPVKMPEAPRPAGPKAKSTTGVNVPDDGGAEVTPPQGLGENKYLSQVSKNQIIKVLEEEYEKILISETVSKSNTSVLNKKQIKEFINYLQTNENVTHANLNEKWPGLGKIIKKVAKHAFGPVGTAIGVGWSAYDYWKNPKQWEQEFNDEYIVPFLPGGEMHEPEGQERGPGGSPGSIGINEAPQNLPESMKAFWKQRLGNQLIERKELGVMKKAAAFGKAVLKWMPPGPDDLIGKAIDVYDRHVDDEFVRQTHDYTNPESPYYDPNRDRWENFPLGMRPTVDSQGNSHPGGVEGGWAGPNIPSGGGSVTA